MQIEWGEGGVWKLAGVVKAGGERVGALCKDESVAEADLGRDRKKMSRWKRDTLGRAAVERAGSAVCGRVISCSRGQERGRTELELCRCESFDDGHRSAALGTAPQRVRCRSGRCFRFVFRWSGVESGEAPWQPGGAPSGGEEAEVADADEAWGAGEVGSDAETHRARRSSLSADCGRHSHANE